MLIFVSSVVFDASSVFGKEPPSELGARVLQFRYGASGQRPLLFFL